MASACQQVSFGKPFNCSLTPCHLGVVSQQHQTRTHYFWTFCDIQRILVEVTRYSSHNKPDCLNMWPYSKLIIIIDLIMSGNRICIIKLSKSENIKYSINITLFSSDNVRGFSITKTYRICKRRTSSISAKQQ